jgi:hypothetical protein
MSDNIRFIHSNHSDNRLRYTLAFSFVKNEESNDIDVVYGVAQCRPNDVFTRKTGREIAANRLEKARKKNTSAGLYYGKLTLKDSSGLNVGRTTAQQFEANRKEFLKSLPPLYDEYGW